MKLSDSNLLFKNKATGKLMTLSSKDVDRVDWQKLGNKPGLKIVMVDGTHHRFGGFKSDVRHLGIIPVYPLPPLFY